MLRNDLERTVTVIEESYSHGTPFPLGNGFFVSLNDRWYLVTCYHVIKRVVANYRSQLQQHQPQVPFITVKLKRGDDGLFHDYALDLVGSDGQRVWRSYPICDDVWDVALVELDPVKFAMFDIHPWSEVDFLRSDAELPLGERIIVFSHTTDYGSNPTPHDFPSIVQRNAGGTGAVIDRSLCPGNSGSLVYRIVKESHQEGTDLNSALQLVGVFTGALMGDPSMGCFHYIDTVRAIAASKIDCLDEIGLEHDDLLDPVRLRRRQQLTSE